MSSVEGEAVAAVKRLADSCAEILQTSLVSAILHGSLTMDDFRPGSSDLDLLLVVERALEPSETDALLEAVRAADLGPAGGVDLLVVTRRTAELPADCPGRELLVGRWPDTGEELEVEGRADCVPDLWPELSEARANGRSLLGPEPSRVIREVPRDRVRANGVGWLRTWLELIDDDKNAVHMVLTACRMWRFELPESTRPRRSRRAGPSNEMPPSPVSNGLSPHAPHLAHRRSRPARWRRSCSAYCTMSKRTLQAEREATTGSTAPLPVRHSKA